MRKFETYPEKNIDEMISGLVAADLGIDFIKKGIISLSDDLKQAAEKFLVDEETEESEPVKGTRRPSDRAARRKATIKAKRKMRRNEPFTDSLVDHGNYIIRKGNTYSWHPEWRKIDKRQRRHEGKNICFNYEADDVATETEDWLTPEDIELLEELEKTERQEWLRDLENFRVTQELEIWEPEDWEPEDEDEEYMETLEAMEKVDYSEWWLQGLEEPEEPEEETEKECNDYEAFLSEFNLWTLFNEWKDRREA